jgi:glycosyltransferase involved in cell wall biosynthesis
LIEAMAAGRPIVATSVGGVPDVVTSGRTGLLVPPGDPHALAEAILDLVRDPDRRRVFAEAARASAPARFGAARLVADTSALYESLLKVPSGGSS